MTFFSLPSTETSTTSTRFAISIAAASTNSETSAGIGDDIVDAIVVDAPARLRCAILFLIADDCLRQDPILAHP
jgi:hypothetical protein